MKIKTNSWHYKLWCFHRYLKDPRISTDILWNEITDENYNDIGNPRNFCQYARVIFIWLPIRILIPVSLYTALFSFFIYVLTTSFTSVAMISIGLVAIVIVAIFVALCLELLPRYANRVMNKVDSKLTASDNVILTYIHSLKNKYCPIIEIEKINNDKA